MTENDREIDIDVDTNVRLGTRSDRVLYSVRKTDHSTGAISRRGFILTGWRARILGWFVSFLVAALVGWVMVAFVVGSWVMIADLWRAF